MTFKKTVQITKNGPTIFKNYNLIRREEAVIVQQTIVECLEQYGIYNTGPVHFTITVVEISKRLKTTAGNLGWKKSHADSWATALTFEIKLAYNNYLEFGFESMIKTLRHEMAHLIEKVLYGKSGHSERFKKICVAIGGHMNNSLAGRKYTDSATKDYCKSKAKKVIYTCGCGWHCTRKRRVNKRTLFARCPRCKGLVMDMKVEVIS